MISDWRGDRRIGAAGLSERLGSSLRFVLLLMAALAAVSAIVVALRRLDDPVNWFINLRFWAMTFGCQVMVLAFVGLFAPRKERAIALGVAGGAVALLVWFMALPILSAFGVAITTSVR
ncbi:hypothetical protein [Brevundimonas sp. FT23028]|uniref:hypothetical protein n=1 Tax=Brevundimonas sp. FT23028 TaxID=3393748 RepID=UPI003B5888AE